MIMPSEDVLIGVYIYFLGELGKLGPTRSPSASLYATDSMRGFVKNGDF
jgi:hypothetical protein